MEKLRGVIFQLLKQKELLLRSGGCMDALDDFQLLSYLDSLEATGNVKLRKAHSTGNEKLDQLLLAVMKAFKQKQNPLTNHNPFKLLDLLTETELTPQELQQHLGLDFFEMDQWLNQEHLPERLMQKIQSSELLSRYVKQIMEVKDSSVSKESKDSSEYGIPERNKESQALHLRSGRSQESHIPTAQQYWKAIEADFIHKVMDNIQM